MGTIGRLLGWKVVSYSEQIGRRRYDDNARDLRRNGGLTMTAHTPGGNTLRAADVETVIIRTSNIEVREQKLATLAELVDRARGTGTNSNEIKAAFAEFWREDRPVAFPALAGIQELSDIGVFLPDFEIKGRRPQRMILLGFTYEGNPGGQAVDNVIRKREEKGVYEHGVDALQSIVDSINSGGRFHVRAAGKFVDHWSLPHIELSMGADIFDLSEIIGLDPIGRLIQQECDRIKIEESQRHLSDTACKMLYPNLELFLLEVLED
ncbi:MAG: hypothetical protein WCT39_05580 [Candidatus Margulisiibacteriota bacterium]